MVQHANPLQRAIVVKRLNSVICAAKSVTIHVVGQFSSHVLDPVNGVHVTTTCL